MLYSRKCTGGRKPGGLQVHFRHLRLAAALRWLSTDSCSRQLFCAWPGGRLKDGISLGVESAAQGRLIGAGGPSRLTSPGGAHAASRLSGDSPFTLTSRRRPRWPPVPISPICQNQRHLCRGMRVRAGEAVPERHQAESRLRESRHRSSQPFGHSTTVKHGGLRSKHGIA